MARESDAELLVLHVIDEGRDEAVHRKGTQRLNHRRFIETQIEARLREAIPAAARGWCRARDIVRTGRTAEEIVRAAQEFAAELVVMGVHGRGALDVMLFGSTTQEIVRHAEIPVLTIGARISGDRGEGLRRSELERVVI
jgi:nucleotide-binding universal stress UspA family protein